VARLGFSHAVPKTYIQGIVIRHDGFPQAPYGNKYNPLVYAQIDS
jgi:hypothetical protein